MAVCIDPQSGASSACQAPLTFGQLESVWVQAGGPALEAPVAAAVALAESGGIPNNINPIDNKGTQTSWGLWQVSQGNHDPYPNWWTPQGNAAVAVAKYKAGNNFKPWGTYNSGAYLQYLNGGSPANLGGAGTTGPGGVDYPPGGIAGTPSATAIGCGTKPDVIKFPGQSIPVVGSVAKGLSFTACEAKAITGGLILFAGAATMAVGVILIAAFALGDTRAGKASKQAVGTLQTPTKAVSSALRSGGRNARAGAGYARSKARRPLPKPEKAPAVGFPGDNPGDYEPYVGSGRPTQMDNARAKREARAAPANRNSA